MQSEKAGGGGENNSLKKYSNFPGDAKNPYKCFIFKCFAIMSVATRHTRTRFLF